MTRSRRRACAVLAVAVLTVVATPRPAFADSIRDREWHIAALQILDAQKLSQGEGVVVAVVDTGVEDKRAELAGAVLPGKGFGEGNDGDGRTDRIGHGTAMAALIAGRGLPGGGGVLGVAPRSMILPLKSITREDGFGAPESMAAAIAWAVDQGAKVICIAAEAGTDQQLQQAVERALRADVVVVAAVGNRPASSSVAFPARLPGVLAVGGTDSTGAHADVSVTGPEVVVAAPAVKVMSVGPAGQYRLGTGTSDATAIVAGVAALVRARYPALSGAEVMHHIAATATDKGKPGRDDEYGFGVVNPVAALTVDVAPASPSAAAPSSAGPAPSRESRSATAWWVVAGFGGLVVALVAALSLRRAAKSQR